MLKSMVALDYIKNTRAYLDYLEEHINNVQKAWLLIQDKCKHMHFVYDDQMFFWIDDEVMRHDISKFSKEEFVPYRQRFHKVDGESVPLYSFDDAWEHHKVFNDHHWETWTTKEYKIPYEWKVHCVHMVIDWVAMSFKFGGTAKEYYEKNKENIILPDYAEIFLYEIFDNLYP